MASNAIASNEVQHATNAAEQQTQYLNSIQQQRMNQANTAALGHYNDFQQGQAQKGQQLGDYLSAQSVGAAAPRSFMAPITNANTQRELGTASTAAGAYGTQQARSLGNQTSFGDYLSDTNRAAGRDLQTADQAADFIKGNANVLGLQLNQAQHAGDGMKLLGSLGTGLGGLGIKAGLNGLGGVPGYGSPIANLFGADNPTYSDVRDAGLEAGLKAYPDGSIY